MEIFVKRVMLNLFGFIIGSMIGALVIQLGTKIIADFKPKFIKAFLASVLGYIVSFIAGFILGVFFAKMGFGLSIGVLAIFLLVGLISQALVIKLIVKPPQGGSLSFLRAVSISGFQTLAGLIFMFLLGFILNILNIKA